MIRAGQLKAIETSQGFLVDLDDLARLKRERQAAR
jgi:hypothetical protein